MSKGYVCGTCHQTVYRCVMWLRNGEWQYRCYVCDRGVSTMPSAIRPFSDLVLEHVLDEQGKPVHVSSLAQLREAEKRYHFRSVVANSDEKNFDNPETVAGKRPKDAFEAMTANNKWMFPDVAKAMLANPQMQQELRRERGER